jgi:signal transduction histidine kinase
LLIAGSLPDGGERVMVGSAHGRRSDAASWPARDTLEHELKTPLTAIRSLSEILRDHPEVSEAERRRFLEAILAEERRLSRAVERLLQSDVGGRRHG